jgi:ketosteroid isomerase-like protein
VREVPHICSGLVVVLGAIGCFQAVAHDTNAVVEASIDKRERSLEACFAKHDATCLVNGYYVSDAQEPIASPPGGQPPVRGRAALIKMFEGMMQDAQAVKLEHVLIIVDGNLASELGLSHVTLKSGKTVTGRFSVLWLHENGGWRAKLDFFSDDGWIS